MYSPAQGRFISRDPTAEAGGDNLYDYAKNDPINWDDPTGMSPTHVSAVQVIEETLAEVKANYPDATSLNESIHWWNHAWTLQHEIADVYSKKLAYYASHDVIVDQPPLPPDGPGLGPDTRSDAQKHADAQVEALAGAINRGEPVTQEAAELGA